MNRLGPIIIVEDDMDDKLLFQMAFENLNCPNEIIFFEDGMQALDFLNITNKVPFLILSDVYMPKVGGFELREQIRTIYKLEIKCIPFLLFSSTATKNIVMEAYGKSVQGFFTKKDSFDDFQKSIQSIIEYWHICMSPGNFKS